MPVLTLGGNSYFAYATVASADEYILPDLNFSIWDALTEDQKTARLIQSSRFIDSLEYIDSANTQAERELIPAFSNASIMIALLITTGSTSILGNTVQEAQNKYLKAGSVETEFFRNTSFYTPTAYDNWPKDVYLVLKPYLKTLSDINPGASSFGTDGASPIDDYSILND